MSACIIVDKPANWPLRIPDIRVISAKDYLTKPNNYGTKWLRVFNLCESYRYQSMGYYVSLLAVARKHKPIPNITTLRSMRLVSVRRII